eukprot:CAMPEP_0204075166 /NCGR_PEP_ID=MMETSP0360-20130528/165952_1 /ASSEMBLY_ACC=CAM_ASM_000342 /TAXON_ID=268821 /ORGANISM="Scrippsiella Hangoei, Strain SHTV-5" /LENGTH=110 /DNA_ID=CAMNT_0051023647 /DNA_START=78 /DNA_END=408 /DNA_ORIENTATION=-
MKASTTNEPHPPTATAVATIARRVALCVASDRGVNGLQATTCEVVQHNAAQVVGGGDLDGDHHARTQGDDPQRRAGGAAGHRVHAPHDLLDEDASVDGALRRQHRGHKRQ